MRKMMNKPTVKRLWCIYVLADGKRKFYVGRTINPKTRAQNHRKQFGKTTSFTIVQRGLGGIKSATKAEDYWIVKLTQQGYILLNKMPAHSGGIFTMAQESRDKLSASLKASYNKPGERERRRAILAAPEARERMSEALKAVWAKPGATKRLSEAQKAGWTEEAKKKQSENTKAQFAKPGAKEKTSEATKEGMQRLLSDPVKLTKYKKSLSKGLREMWADPIRAAAYHESLVKGQKKRRDAEKGNLELTAAVSKKKSITLTANMGC